MASAGVKRPSESNMSPTNKRRLTSSVFREPELILNPLSDDVNSMIRNEMHRVQHNYQQQQHHHQHHQQHQHQQQHQNQKPQLNTQYLQHNQPTVSAQVADNPDLPVLTIRQTQMICEKLIREREQKLREEYDKILISKLAEQYETYVKYTRDHIEKRYNETNSHQSSYLS